MLYSIILFTFFKHGSELKQFYTGRVKVSTPKKTDVYLTNGIYFVKMNTNIKIVNQINEVLNSFLF